MGQVGRTRRRAAAFAAVPAPAAEEPRGNRSMPRGSPAAGRMKTMTGALITRFDDQVGPRERRSVRENSPRRARSSLNPRARTSSRRYRGLSDDLGGYPAISRTAVPQGGGAQGDDGRAEGPDLADAAGNASAVDLGPCSSDQRPVGALTQHPSFLGSRPGTPGGSPSLWHPRTVNVHSAAGLIGDARQRGPAHQGPFPRAPAPGAADVLTGEVPAAPPRAPAPGPDASRARARRAPSRPRAPARRRSSGRAGRAGTT